MSTPHPGSLSFDGILRFRGSKAIYISPDIKCEWWISPSRLTGKLKLADYEGKIKISHNFFVIEKNLRTLMHSNQTYLAGEYLVMIGDRNSIYNMNKLW